MSRDHRKLEVFGLADTLALNVYALTTKLPKEERYGLQAQIRKAAVSVPTNVVEGCARSSDSESCRFLEIALGSAREVAYLLSVAVRLGYLSAGEVMSITERYSAVQGKLHGVIAAISPRRSSAMKPRLNRVT